MGLFYQILGSIIANYVGLTMGLMFAWPSSTYTLFGSKDTTLDRPMTEYELALFGSLSSIGSLISNPIAGYCMHVYGRKYTNLLCATTYAIAWILVALFSKVEVILVASFISGLGGAVFLVVSVFIAEFCQESIRGTMTSTVMVTFGFGLLLSYLLGGILDYYLMVYLCLGMAVFGVVILFFLKESPTYLMQTGRDEEAAKSIAFYRSVTPSSSVVLEEMEKIRQSLNPDLDGDVEPFSPVLQPLRGRLNTMDTCASHVTLEVVETMKLEPTETLKSDKKLTQWEYIKRSSSTRRAMVVCLVTGTASIFQGFVVLQVYTAPLFEEAVPNWSATTSSVLLALVAVIAGVFAAFLTDVSGRRALMIYGSVASGLCCVVLGTQLHLCWGPHWITVVFINLFCIAYTLGAGSVPYVLIAEVFLPEIRSLMTMLAVEWAWLCNFIILFMFNPLVARVGLGPVFYFFAMICFVTAIYCAIYQPETKGLTVNEIQPLFSKKRTQKD